MYICISCSIQLIKKKEEKKMGCFSTTLRNPNNVDTLLVSAIKGQNIDNIKELLNDEENDPGAYNDAAIQVACTKSSLEIVMLLLEHQKVDPSANNSNALYRAVKCGEYEIVVELLKDKRINPDHIIGKMFWYIGAKRRRAYNTRISCCC
jgi:ankyrin repeat protein